jgi:hypothetical protein
LNPCFGLKFCEANENRKKELQNDGEGTDRHRPSREG